MQYFEVKLRNIVRIVSLYHITLECGTGSNWIILNDF